MDLDLLSPPDDNMDTSDSPGSGSISSYTLNASVGLVGSLVAVLLSLAAPAQAQNIQWGMSAGVSSSSLKGDASAVAGQSFVGTELPAQFAGSRTGFHLGVTLRTPLTTWLAARTALRYTQQGGVVDRDLLGPADGRVNETAEFQFDYVTVPILAELRSPSRIAGFRPSVYAGPALGLNLRSKAQREAQRDYGTSRGTVNSTSDVETPSAVISVVTGAEVAYRLPNGDEVGLDLRYSYGLTDVVTQADAAARLGGIRMGLHYVFP